MLEDVHGLAAAGGSANVMEQLTLNPGQTIHLGDLELADDRQFHPVKAAKTNPNSDRTKQIDPQKQVPPRIRDHREYRSQRQGDCQPAVTAS